MPGDAGAGGDGPKLVDDVARDEVDVVVTETHLCVANSVSAHLVEFGFLDPLSTLWREGGGEGGREGAGEGGREGGWKGREGGAE